MQVIMSSYKNMLSTDSIISRVDSERLSGSQPVGLREMATRRTLANSAFWSMAPEHDRLILYAPSRADKFGSMGLPAPVLDKQGKQIEVTPSEAYLQGYKPSKPWMRTTDLGEYSE